MDTDNSAGKIPASLQKEIRSKLGALGIKMTLTAEQLQAETDPVRAQELRDQIVVLKAEAKSVVEKYRWAKSTYGEDLSQSASPLVDPDGVLVFGDMDLSSPVSEPLATPVDSVAQTAADFGDVELVLDLAGADPDALPPPIELPLAREDESVLLDEVTFSLDLVEAAEGARERPAARGGRLGLAFGLAVEFAGSREAEWGGSLLAAALETASLALARGADEEETAAAALFATIEYATEDLALQEIRSLLGDRVVELVAWSAWMLRVDPWEQRDRAYLTRMQSAPVSALFVSLAGRAISSRAMLARRAAAGTGALDRPGRERERLVWSQRALVKAYRALPDVGLGLPFLEEWDRAIETLESRASA